MVNRVIESYGDLGKTLKEAKPISVYMLIGLALDSIACGIFGVVFLKLKGLELSIAVLALMNGMNSVKGFVTPIFKDTASDIIMNSYIVATVLVALWMASYSLVPTDAWLIVLSFILLPMNVMLQALFIQYDTMLARVCDAKQFKNMQHLESVIMSTTNLLAAGMVGTLSTVVGMEGLIYISIGITAMSLLPFIIVGRKYIGEL